MNAVKIRRTQDVEVRGLGKKIEQARRSDGRSLEALASAAGMSRVHWYDIEKEKVRDALPEETLRRIEQVLGIDFGVSFK